MARIGSLVLPSLLAAAGITFGSTESGARPPTWGLRADEVAPGRARLGVVILPMSPELRAALGAPDDRGVLVDRVSPDSPAAKAGVKVGDVIAEVDAQPVESREDVVRAISDHKRGDVVPLRILRGKISIVLPAMLDSDPMPESEGWHSIAPQGPVGPGFSDDDGPPPDGTWRSWSFRWPEDARQLMGQDEAVKKLERRIEELEKKLDELQKKLAP